MKLNQYFMVDINNIKKILKEYESIELKLDIESFNKLDEKYRKIVLVIPFIPPPQGWVFEIVSNYAFDIKGIKKEINSSNKLIECIGYEKVSFSFKTLLNKMDEKDVYKFFKSLEDNGLMDTYKDAINNLFYGGLSDEIYLNENKQLQKIRRKYE